MEMSEELLAFEGLRLILQMLEGKGAKL